MKNGWTCVYYLVLWLIHWAKVRGIKVEKVDSIWQKGMCYGALSQLPTKVVAKMRKKKVRIWYSRNIHFYGIETKRCDGFYYPEEQIIFIRNGALI